MAIVEKTSYIKIIPEMCYVDDFVHVTIDTYDTEQDRIKEKERLDDVYAFVSEVESDLNRRAEGFEIDEEFINAAQNTVSDIQFAFLQYNKNDPYILEILDEEILSYLLEHRLNPIWYQDPIFKLPLRVVSCGIYNGEELTTKFYYNKLKEVMNPEIIHDA